jgi:PAS domain S-box-containing protein
MSRESAITGGRKPDEARPEGRVGHEVRDESAVPNELSKDKAHDSLSSYKTEIEELRDQLEDAQLALEVAESRYLDLYGAAPIAFLTVGSDGRIVSCNRRAADLLGVPPVALNRRRLPDFMPDESAEYFTESYRTLYAAKPITLELQMRRANGQNFWAELSMVITPEDGANVCRVALTDQSARKRMQEGAAQLAAIVTSADQAIISEDLDGIILSWNAGAEKLFGYSAQQAVGFSVEMLVPADRKAEERDFRARVRSGSTVAKESLRLNQNGTLVPVFVAASPILGPRGHVIGVSQIVRDISEQVADRQEVTRLLEDLRIADRRKDDFIATLAHELRNPLAPIRNAAAVMRFVPGLDPKLQWCRDVIDRQVGHMAALLEDLLDVSRLTRDVIKLRRDRVELGSAIAQAIEITRPLMDSRGHALSVELASEPIEVEGDLTRLTQIFGNLLNNAAKYTEPNGKICVRVEQRGSEVDIRVHDNGMGIEKENLASIFDLFSQVDPTREGHQGGLGIGLALVKGLIERHRGSIVAHSEGPGQGSEFVVTLPVARPAVGEAFNNGDSPRQRRGTARSLRVLVVDDNLDAAESMAVMLRNSQHDARTANDGATALALAAEMQPDVIVLDLGMPRMSGYEVATRIRQEPWGSDVFMVACTGWGQPEDRRRSREAGFNHHLVKPVSMDDVLQLLDDLGDAGSG